jgi:hypothetical protein
MYLGDQNQTVPKRMKPVVGVKRGNHAQTLAIRNMILCVAGVSLTGIAHN